MNYRECYLYGREKLKAAEIAEYELDARLLLEAVCHTDRTTMFAHPDREVDDKEYAAYAEYIAKRAEHIPLQHLTGVQDFMGLEFYVNQDVLIPRQDTEILVEEVMLNLHDGMRILDMCTGSGCILCSLLHYSNDCQGVGVDLSERALAVAEENAEKLAVRNYSFIKSDLFEKVEGKFDMIVSNPPYIKSDVIRTLMPEVRDHEPLMALDGMDDGLLFYRKIIAEAEAYLWRGGKLFFEIGYDQGEAVGRLMREAGFRDVCVKKDYAGLDRVVFGEI